MGPPGAGSVQPTTAGASILRANELLTSAPKDATNNMYFGFQALVRVQLVLRGGVA
jgi:hypothetical protein